MGGGSFFYGRNEAGIPTLSAAPRHEVGEALGSKEYKEFKEPPKAVGQWTKMLASNTAHLARLLKASNYPGMEGGR